MVFVAIGPRGKAAMWVGIEERKMKQRLEDLTAF
jgi:hypothetical protein